MDKAPHRCRPRTARRRDGRLINRAALPKARCNSDSPRKKAESMGKIKVANPVVEHDGKEMTRIIWQRIPERLILPYLDSNLHYNDPGIEERDRPDRKDTAPAANALRKARRSGGRENN